jgi:hypothetical protein
VFGLYVPSFHYLPPYVTLDSETAAFGVAIFTYMEHGK